MHDDGPAATLSAPGTGAARPDAPAGDTAPPTPPPGAAGRRALYLAAGVILLALNLRPALVAVSPLANTIRDESGMSAAATSLLTALPLLCFGCWPRSRRGSAAASAWSARCSAPWR